VEQADLTQHKHGAAAWRAHVEDLLRAEFRKLCENLGNKAVAQACATTASAITMAYNGERPIPVGWLLGIRALDPENVIGKLLARLVYAADLKPIAVRTPAEERDLLLSELGQMGEPGKRRSARSAPPPRR
jgi:hypothetical protein